MNTYSTIPLKILAILTLCMLSFHVGIACHECVEPGFVDPATGNARRRILDIPATEGQPEVLSWVRYHNTMPRLTDQPVFGHGECWRHSWQYELSFGKPGVATLIYPSGLTRNFTKNENGRWLPQPAFDEQMEINDDCVRIITPGDEILVFKPAQTTHQGKLWLLASFQEPQGGVITLQYNEQGLLMQATDQYNNGVILEYAGIPHAARARGWLEIGTPALDPETGEYNISPGEALRGIRFIEVRVVDSNGLPIPKTSIRSRSVDGTINTQTRYSAQTHRLQLDAPGCLEKIFITCAPEYEAALATATVEGQWSEPAHITTVLSRVAASDGRNVEYGYHPMEEKSRHIVLAEARYSDDTAAFYTYDYVHTTRAPLLTACDDPRHPRAHKKIQYAYYPDRELGVIHKTIDPGTQATLLTLEFDDADPNFRAIHYKGNRIASYIVHEEIKRITSTTDSHGRTTTFKYANDGLGKLMTRQVEGGLATNYIRDADNKLVEIRLSDGTTQPASTRRARQGNIFRTPASPSFPKPVTTSPTDEVIRNERGQITQITNAGGRIQAFTYDKYGNKIRETDGTNEIIYEYDSIGRVISKTDARGTTICSYDNDRLVEQRFPNGTVRRYDHVHEKEPRNNQQAHSP